MNKTDLPPLPQGHRADEYTGNTIVYGHAEAIQAQADARNAVIDQIVEIIRNTQAGAKRLATADYILTLKIDAAPTGPAQPDGEKQ